MKKTLLIIICFFAYIFIKAQTLYGTTAQGGSDGGGTINMFQLATNNLIVAKSFESIATNPGFANLVQAKDGKLYGTTAFGGSSGMGVIFSLDPSSSTFTKLKDFDNINGAVPNGSLIQAKDGKLYGMTTFGGSNDAGVMFSYDPLSSNYTKVVDFNNTNGGHPHGSLIQAKDGKLYGMTSDGGTSGAGVIFSFDPSSFIYTKLKDFDNTTGADPLGSLMQASDGKLYGMTASGGSSSNGVIFSFHPSSSTYKKLKDFDNTDGYYPEGSLMQASDGKLYGMTAYGGSSGVGVIFSFRPSSSAYTKLRDFDNTNGSFPYGSLLQASDGKLYGMSVEGGSNNAGVLFSLDPYSFISTKLKDFDYNNGALPLGTLMQTSNGKIYGMTSQGGSSSRGVIFSFDPVKSDYTIVKDLGTNENGAYVSASLTQATDGRLYGMTNSGGKSGVGVIFSFDRSSSTYKKLKDFDNSNGGQPRGSLMQASDGKLYGMTTGGGSNGYGVIFSFDPSSNNYTKLKDFDYINGAYPIGGNLIQASNGKLYGMTTYGGNSDVGVIFSFDPSSFTYAKLLDFDFYTNGGYSDGSLTEASNGKLYGTTTAGGTSEAGVIFSFDPSSSFYTKLKDFEYIDGRNPVGRLAQASDGKLYGMTFTSLGGYGVGVIFSFDPSTFTYTKLKDFDGTDGANPLGSLIQASNGKLYGMTEAGGTSKAGVIFSFNPLTSTYTKLIDYNGANGATPYLGSAFIEDHESTKALLKINDNTVYETAGLVTLTVALSKKNDQAVSVNYKTMNGTAKMQLDYIAKNGIVTIPAGSQTATISIKIMADNALEPSEKFYVELGKPVNAGIAEGTGTVTILDGAPLSTSTVQQQVVDEKQEVANELILKASPNPSSSRFALEIQTDNPKDLLNLRVVDVLGRLIEIKKSISAEQTLQIGNNYKPGVYLVEVTQGNIRKQLKLIKLPQ